MQERRENIQIHGVPLHSSLFGDTIAVPLSESSNLLLLYSNWSLILLTTFMYSGPFLCVLGMERMGKTIRENSKVMPSWLCVCVMDGGNCDQQRMSIHLQPHDYFKIEFTLFSTCNIIRKGQDTESNAFDIARKFRKGQADMLMNPLVIST
ncbi:hypothetical protein ACJX0J_026873 [Zea mays]